MCRITILFLILALVVAWFYLNKVGLPDFVNRRIVAQLRDKGWEVEFSRLRLRGLNGLLVEDLSLHRSEQRPGPWVFLDTAECRFSLQSLKRLKAEVESVMLDGGRILYPLAPSNSFRTRIQFEQAEGELFIRTNDVWELRGLRGHGFNTTIQLSGTLTNASFVRDWKFSPRTDQSLAATETMWRRIITNARQLKVMGESELKGEFSVDARDLRNLEASLEFSVTAASSPWGSGTDFQLDAHVTPAAGSNHWVRGDLRLSVENAATLWGQAKHLELSGVIEPSYSHWLPTNAHLTLEIADGQNQWAAADHLSVLTMLQPDPLNPGQTKTEIKAVAKRLRGDWGDAESAQLTARSLHPATSLAPASFASDFIFENPKTRWGQAVHAVVSSSGTIPSTVQMASWQTNLSWPDRLEKFPLDAKVTVTGLDSPQLRVESSSTVAQWRFPRLHLETTNTLYEGAIFTKLEIDASTRECSFSGRSTIDARKISPLLNTNGQVWIAQYSWKTPPALQAQGRVVLPAWTNRQPDWRGEVLPTLSIAGGFELGDGAFRGLSFVSARSIFLFTNLTWRLPDLQVTRPEGNLAADYVSDALSRDYRWRFRSRLDVKAIRPLLEKETERKSLDFFEFSEPPDIEAEVRGRWRDIDRLSFTAQVWATNFMFRGERVTDATARLFYTNKLLTVVDPAVRQGKARATASAVLVDFPAQKVYLTNAFGDLNPHAIARTIGARAAEAIEPYRFDSPPTSRVYGTVDWKKGRHEEDLHFDISGGPFHWKQFNLDQIHGRIDWTGVHLNLTNMTGLFRAGQVAGGAQFNFAPEVGTEFAFNISMTNLDLQSLTADLGYKTNKIEGRLNGDLTVNRAQSNDKKSWQGQGALDLRDGLIWDLPVFSVFSPILNAFIPGLGNSRAKQATAAFMITNGVIISKDLEIHATAMRMHFDGSVDFDKRVEGRMEAELLRDMPAFGFLLSKLLWPVTKLFEYKVSGTLDQPKTEPLFLLPKIVLMPFHPFKTIQNLLQDEETDSSEPKP